MSHMSLSLFAAVALRWHDLGHRASRCCRALTGKRSLPLHLQIVQDHLAWLCSSLPRHTITDVQTAERVSLLLKDSFLESFAPRERAFMKQLVETQTFSVFCDSVIR